MLENPIEGIIWLRTQNSSDPASGEMFRIALELKDERHGIDIKVPGQVAANPLTGQLTSTFDNAPQLPFEDLTLHFKAGARSPLRTPPSCGKSIAAADLYSWAQPDVPVRRNISVEIASGAEGTSCASPSQFNPGFEAGVSSVQAGAFTPFLATFSGGEAFPDLVIVLQGYGVTVDLVGTTFIGKAGITSTTFKIVPDVPVGTFELKLSQGRFSALAANGNLCKSSLKMPTTFMAQDRQLQAPRAPATPTAGRSLPTASRCSPLSTDASR